MNALDSAGLGRRYRARWGLRHVDLTIPEHAVVGLVGPNGAGKSTLLHLATGLISPTEGALRVLGKAPGSREALSDVAFVAQDAPLPRRMRVRDVVTLAQDMNVRWDADAVESRIDSLRLDRGHRIGELSGGQRAQLALALALAKQPRLLLLDEPVASLDPLARRGFLQALMAAVAEGGLTVVFSTHLLDDLERICDHLVVLGQGTLALTGSIDDIVARHAVLVGPAGRPLPRGATVIGGNGHGGHQHLVSITAPILDPGWEQLTPSLEEVVLAHLQIHSGNKPRTPAHRLEVA
ncbi:MAG: ABC transporter ATP-binding protein [Acidimicrobiia bacterium]|nr:ABC transporter ATP-binding protein [Acidimicrobiia bacterium]